MVEPGRSIAATAAVTLYRVGHGQGDPRWIGTYVAVDGGMSDNPRPVLYGAGYEAFLPGPTWCPATLECTVVGKHCEQGDIIVADARLPGDVAVGDLLVTPGDRRVRLLDGVQLQQGPAAGGRVRPRWRGPDRRAPGDARRPDPTGCLSGAPPCETAIVMNSRPVHVGLLGCGNVGSALVRLVTSTPM